MRGAEKRQTEVIHHGTIKEACSAARECEGVRCLRWATDSGRRSDVEQHCFIIGPTASLNHIRKTKNAPLILLPKQPHVHDLPSPESRHPSPSSQGVSWGWWGVHERPPSMMQTRGVRWDQEDPCSGGGWRSTLLLVSPFIFCCPSSISTIRTISTIISMNNR